MPAEREAVRYPGTGMGGGSRRSEMGGVERERKARSEGEVVDVVCDGG